MDDEIFLQVQQHLENIDRETVKNFSVVLLPDFSVDHIVSLPDFQQSMSQIESRFKQAGGNIPGISQVIQQGGNAANTALALARLGIHSHLICKTNQIGQYLLDFFLKQHGVDISHVQADGALASTIALEFGKNHSNIFLQDAGSIVDFGVKDLTDADWDLIKSVDLVGVMNWSLNKKGTELARAVFEYAKKYDVKTYIDTGDPSPRSEDISDFIEVVLASGFVDCFSLNENEIRKYSGKESCKTTDEILEACSSLHAKVKARLDVHTAVYSYSISDSMNAIVPGVSLPRIYRSTGAGDTWNAGNITGELLGFSFEQRLAFANLLAACYISKTEPLPPTFNEVKEFLNMILVKGR